jgi:biopolymer transport protein ExbD
MANLALLILTIVMISGMFAASRGPAMRFASSAGVGSFDERGAVRVAVGSEGEISLDGVSLPAASLGEALRARLAGSPGGAVVLLVSPDASYQAMIDAYATISQLPGPPRIAFPARARRGTM